MSFLSTDYADYTARLNAATKDEKIRSTNTHEGNTKAFVPVRVLSWIVLSCSKKRTGTLVFTDLILVLNLCNRCNLWIQGGFVNDS